MGIRQFNVHLCDLRHNAVGRHSTYMPVAIGYIASYAKSLYGDRATFSLHAEAEDIITEINAGNVDMLGLSNYTWNAELTLTVARHAKKHNPNMIVVVGGPEFPTQIDEIRDYLISRDAVDFYVYNYEGEVAFASILEHALNGESKEQIIANLPEGVACLNSNNEVLKSSPPARLKALDIIPSPYLSGMMDKFFDGSYMPFLETTRGCPYACTYCVQGDGWYNKIYGFTTERVFAELSYIAERMLENRSIPLALSDSNFGMYPRDVETAEFIASLMEKYDWPRSFIVDTGKAQMERLVQVATKLKKKIQMSISPQTLNPETLVSIKRKNLGEKDLGRVYDEFKKHGIPTNAAIIVPLPRETKASYLEGLRILSDSHVDMPLAYTTMLLKGTGLATRENRETHQMKTRYRLLPRQFSVVNGQRVVEFDEVCIATNTMSFDEYIECRGASFLFLGLSAQQFDFLRPVCQELSVEWFDVLLAMWKRIKVDAGPVGQVYKQFVQASHDELFDSPEAILEFVSVNANYQKLLDGEVGETVMRNFVPKFALNTFKDASTMAIDVIREMRPGVNWLDSVEQWVHTSRDIMPLLMLEDDAFQPITLTIDYDIDSWLRAENRKAVEDYSSPPPMTVTADYTDIKQSVISMQRLYGDEPLRWASRLMEIKPLKEIWRHTA